MNDDQEILVERIRRMRRGLPPEPWRHVASHGIGGLTDIGYGEGSDLLLVVSHNGRGVFDCLSGERVARDRVESYPRWRELLHLTAPGIGPLKGQDIPTAGLHGGGMRTLTEDGWSLELLSPDWPNSFVALEPPRASVWDERTIGGCVGLDEERSDDDVRAYGFSPTGNSFAIAVSSHTLEIYCRVPEPPAGS